VGLRPCHRKVTILAVNERLGEIELGRIQMREHVNPVAREILDLIQLVTDDHARWKMAHRGEPWILDDNRALRDAPGVLVEPTAEQVAELRPREECGRR